MSLSEEYPPPIVLKRNEIKTFEFLYSNPFLNEQFPMLAYQAGLQYFHLKDRRHLNDAPISFETELDIIIEGQLRRLFIGVNIINRRVGRDQYKYDLVSYYLSICENNTPPSELLRKFHFDYNDPEQETDQPIPVFHTQYGGELSDYLKEKVLDEEKLEPWLSVPRLNHCPLTLALLLDIVFCEFPSEQTTRIAERNEWRCLIKENEELVVRCRIA